ncbi:MAG: hypothetical protein UT94_C0048G0009 [Candidatus Uhrbacteria bacterium GW2011_GWF2_40_263]|nr:MAG: hypothetical protein UT94_C0048G0009 [Candidatus Uhrbacteria bacterium GW2011_GWF2_40_263]
MVYTGLTNDLKRRFSEHQAGKVKSTKHRLPVKLIGYEAYSLQSDAQRRERFLKTSEGRALFRKQYRDILKKNWRGTQVVGFLAGAGVRIPPSPPVFSKAFKVE